MLSKLTLKNFRCFKELTIDQFRPLTLLTGKNSVGKSTVLEAIFLLSKYNQIEVFFELNMFRNVPGQVLEPEAVWGPFFRNTNENAPIGLGAMMDGKNFSVHYIKEQGTFLAGPAIMPVEAGVKAFSPAPFPPTECLKFVFKSMDYYSSGLFVLSPNGSRMIPEAMEKPEDCLPPRLPRTIMRNIHVTNLLPAALTEVDFSGKKGEVVKALQCIDDRIGDISVGMRGGLSLLYVDVGKGQKIPVTSMGDGVVNILQIILSILTNPGGIMLVDELEIGFHHSALEKLWELIAIMAKSHQCQVIATTHSYECIQAAASAILSSEAEKDFVLMRLDRRGENIVAVEYEDELLQYVVDKEVEVRG